jgi:hypothetical protein
MKKVRKITPRLVDELIELRNSRESIDEFIYSFLKNFSENCKLMHSYLKPQVPKEFIYIAYRQYFVFLISCWETFFRDIFVYVYSTNESLMEKLLQKISDTDESSEYQDIPLSELLTKSFNFQNMGDLELALSDIFDKSFLEYICQTQTDTCGLNGNFTHDFSIDSLCSEWREIIEKTFNIRHKVVHDASFRPEYNVEFVQKSETIFLMIPQIATYFLAKRFNLKSIVLSNEQYSAPYLFSIKDILAEDYYIVK